MFEKFATWPQKYRDFFNFCTYLLATKYMPSLYLPWPISWLQNTLLYYGKSKKNHRISVWKSQKYFGKVTNIFPSNIRGSLILSWLWVPWFSLVSLENRKSFRRKSYEYFSSLSWLWVPWFSLGPSKVLNFPNKYICDIYKFSQTGRILSYKYRKNICLKRVRETK